MNQIDLNGLCFSYNLKKIKLTDFLRHKQTIIDIGLSFGIDGINSLNEKNIFEVIDFFKKIELKILKSGAWNSDEFFINTEDNLLAVFSFEKIRYVAELVYVLAKEVYGDDFLLWENKVKEKMSATVS
jgi:hypothetical protein